MCWQFNRKPCLYQLTPLHLRWLRHPRVRRPILPHHLSELCACLCLLADLPEDVRSREVEDLFSKARTVAPPLTPCWAPPPLRHCQAAQFHPLPDACLGAPHTLAAFRQSPTCRGPCCRSQHCRKCPELCRECLELWTVVLGRTVLGSCLGPLAVRHQEPVLPTKILDCHSGLTLCDRLPAVIPATASRMMQFTAGALKAGPSYHAHILQYWQPTLPCACDSNASSPSVLQYGRIRSVDLKTPLRPPAFAFVEFEEPRCDLQR